MDRPIEELYFDWLCAKVKVEQTMPDLEFFRILHSHIFADPTGLDENRVADAKELRENFLDEKQIGIEQSWVDQDCSVFEILISFSAIAAFQIDIPREIWFWQFITNLGLDYYRGASEADHPFIFAILDRFVSRTYEPNGDGGMFPLRRPQHDQRGVEIWYQFCEYVADNGLLYGLV